MSPEEIAAMIVELQRAMASGALEIETYTQGVRKRVQYRALGDMRAALADLQAMQSGKQNTRRTVASFTNGTWPAW